MMNYSFLTAPRQMFAIPTSRSMRLLALYHLVFRKTGRASTILAALLLTTFAATAQTPTITNKIPAAAQYLATAQAAQQTGDRNYEQVNHLGNVLSVVTDRKLPASADQVSIDFFTADLLSYSDYYPFGMAMVGRNGNMVAYRYGFQGQEADDQTGLINYKYRMHDPRVGRFFAIDPLTAEFPWNSPYAFSENRLIDGVELEGLEVVILNEEKDPFLMSHVPSYANKPDLHVITHGSYERIGDNAGKYVTTREEFELELQKSPLYANQVKEGKVQIVLHACLAGRPAHRNPDGRKPFAQRMSLELHGAIIAADEPVIWNYWGEQGPYRDVLTGNCKEQGSDGECNKWGRRKERGNWMIFKDGVLIEVYDGAWSPSFNPTEVEISKYKKDLTYRISATDGVSMASSNGERVVRLEHGAVVTPTGNVSNGWLEVKSENGSPMWIHTDDVTPEY